MSQDLQRDAKLAAEQNQGVVGRKRAGQEPPTLPQPPPPPAPVHQPWHNRDADRIGELQDELNCTRDELDDAVKLIETLRAENKRLLGERNTAQSRALAIEAQLDKAQREIADQHAEIGLLRQERALTSMRTAQPEGGQG